MKLCLIIFIISSYLYSATPEFSTFWGGMNRAARWTHNKGKIKKLKVLEFNSENKVPVYIYEHAEKKPLIIFYTGVFGEPDSRISKHIIDELEQKNNHLLLMPNLVSASFLSARPIDTINPWAKELLNQKQLLQTALKEIPKEKISKIILVAESLGSWQAVMIAIQNIIPIEKLIFIWPPLDLHFAIDSFDRVLNTSKPIYETCTYWYKWPKVYLDYKTQTLPNTIDSEDEKCLGAFVMSGGFVKAIKKVSQKTFEKRKQKYQNPPDTFGNFIKQIMPEYEIMLHDKSNKLTMIYWLETFKKSKIDLFFYSSKDDFLNELTFWDGVKEKIGSEKVFLYDWGGHSGVAGTKEFWEKLRGQLP